MSETLQTLILAGHIMVGILLVTIILIQRGKGSDAGMAFGGGASGTVFGATGSGTFLTKTTKWLAIAFFSTSLALAYVHNNKTAPTSILDTVEDVQQKGEVSPVAAPMPDAIEVKPGLNVVAPEGVSVDVKPLETAVGELGQAVDTAAGELGQAVDTVADKAKDVLDESVSDVKELVEEVPQGE